MSTLAYNPNPLINPGIPVSPLNIKSLLNWSPRVCAHVMLWFDPASTSHLNIGYNSSDPAIVAGQVAYLKARGVDFAILEWYGTDAVGMNAAALRWKSECEKQGLNFAIGLDGGMFKSWYMPSTTTPNAYLAKQMQYVAANFFTSPNYEKTADGRCLMINFGFELVSGLTPSTVMVNYPNVALLWENANGTSRPSTAGAFAWIGVGTDTQGALEAYASHFLSTVSKAVAANPKLIIMGSIVKGFDDHGRKPGLDPTKSCWDQTIAYRFADERRGQTLLDVIALYNQSSFKPAYMQIVTFTDHEEGTAFEWGIDSLVKATLTALNGVLTVSIAGNLNTVDHIHLVVNDRIVALDSSLTFDLNTLKPVNNQQFTCQAVVTGRPLFQQKLSNTVTTTAVLVPTQTVQLPIDTTVDLDLDTSVTVNLDTQVFVDVDTQAIVPVSAAVDVPIDTSVTVPVSGSVAGLSLSGSVVVPVQQTVSVPVQQSVQVPVKATVPVAVQQAALVPVKATVAVPAKGTATVVVTTQTVWQ